MQNQNTFFRLGTAAVVGLTMFVCVQGLTRVSQHHIERNLAQYSTHTQAVQLAHATASQHA
ncbi:hypothetical protein [Chitinimonas naiadis]